jgi:dTMP kinase
MLITIEGLPYAGKKVQRNMLAEALTKMGYHPTTQTSFTGWNSQESLIINSLAVNGPGTPLEKLFLFLADQAGFMDRLVRPVFKYGSGYLNQETGRPNNPAIICAGGPDSIVAFQGFGEKLAGVKQLAEMRDIALGGTLPDLTIYLDIHVDEMMARVPQKERSFFEQKGPEYYNNVRKGFLEIGNVEGDRVKMVKANVSDEEIHERVMDVVRHHLAENRR